MIVVGGSMRDLAGVSGALRAIIDDNLLLLGVHLGVLGGLCEQVLRGHGVVVDLGRAHADEVEVELVADVLLFDNPLLDVNVLAHHKWRLILGGPLLRVAGSALADAGVLRGRRVVSFEAAHRLAVRRRPRLLRGVLQRVVAVCAVRLINVVPRADHAHAR